jgi:hypothetical protein
LHESVAILRPIVAPRLDREARRLEQAIDREVADFGIDDQQIRVAVPQLAKDCLDRVRHQ